MIIQKVVLPSYTLLAMIYKIDLRDSSYFCDFYILISKPFLTRKAGQS